ncbi:DUF5050 domain-containing protein [Desnuesiella massiliensis]|uniref:DUF5050 domain-containing protein n=1 Tax=Desnuesiella massiliensis TaxID=1650662 RepID=UPI0006E1A37C|nr:DUF5050 domain-containing protein [Desnuesiella massiliensis]
MIRGFECIGGGLFQNRLYILKYNDNIIYRLNDGIYKKNALTGTIEKIYEEAVNSLTLANNKLYFIKNGEVYMMDLDGNNIENLHLELGFYNDLCTMNDKLYINNIASERTYNINLKDHSLDTILNRVTLCFTVDEHNDKYFVDDQKAYLIKKPFSTIICETNGANQLFVDNSCVYFTQPDKYFRDYDMEEEVNNYIYKVKIKKNSTPTELCQDNVREMCLYKDWIYYSNKDDGYALYKIKTDGSLKTKLNDENTLFINIFEDELYYFHNIPPKDIAEKEDELVRFLSGEQIEQYTSLNLPEDEAPTAWNDHNDIMNLAVNKYLEYLKKENKFILKSIKI